MNIKFSEPAKTSDDNSLAEQLAAQVLRWTPQEGVVSTAIAELELYRTNTPHSCTSSVYEPCLCFLIQGRKTIQLGDQNLVFGPLHYLTTSVHLPVVSQIIDVSPEEPFLAAKISIDPQEINDLLLIIDGKNAPADKDTECAKVGCGLFMATMDLSIQDALHRLFKLLDSPQDIAVLAPLIRREIIYRTLLGEMGPSIRRFALNDSRANRISHVIALLKSRFAEPLRVKELAEVANMSESNLFQNFKQVTRMSPVQFQKRLRLHEARRLMMTEGMEAATASYRVGYESPSHFSREYRRMFGASPKADISKLRGEPLGSTSFG